MKKLTRSDILNFMRDKAYRPLLFEELVKALGVSRKATLRFRKTIDSMLEEGLIVKIRGERYGLPEKMDLRSGVLEGHPDGYGFVVTDIEGEPDIYIPRRNMMGAMHGDRVVVRIEKGRKGERPVGRIIRILERFHKKIVGRFEKGKNFGFIVPVDRKIFHDIYVAPNNFHRARNGDIVVATIITYPQKNRNPEGKIIKVLGSPSVPGTGTEIIVEEYELPVEFPPRVLHDAEKIHSKVTSSMIRGRVDLRNLKTVTIDGEKAKDFDDAVSVEKLPNGFIRLWVHIADVSHYVPWNSPLDIEARYRGTSVYFPDRVIPMFPENLSNIICSLNPGEDRLTVTVDMLFDPKGTRMEYRIYESVINSDERMTYTDVRKILVDRDPKLLERYSELIKYFHIMEELCLRLRKKRMKRGSIDFDLPEPEIILDIQGRTVDIIQSERNIAHQIIEEFMLAANETVAQHMSVKGGEFIYRVHEPPDSEKVLEFNEFVNSLGYTYKLNHKNPKTFQRLLRKFEEKPEERLINQLLLRTMKQARYSTENLGHFGLASQHYTHFTSPIRRYPDLVVHRLLKNTSLKKSKKRRKGPDMTILEDIAKHSSERERLAMEAEREAVELKKLEFMKDKIGEEYNGIISGVTAFGFFVEIEDILVEGLVRVTSLYDDFYRLDEKGYRLIGDRFKRIFRLGDRIKVRVDNVDLDRKKIDFILVK